MNKKSPTIGINEFFSDVLFTLCTKQKQITKYNISKAIVNTFLRYAWTSLVMSRNNSFE